jgi:hypothetical protein
VNASNLRLQMNASNLCLQMNYFLLYLQEARTGVVPSDIQVYLEGHKGLDAQNPVQLCSQAATEHLVRILHN